MACSRTSSTEGPINFTRLPLAITLLIVFVLTAGCTSRIERQSEVRPLSLRDVPAQRLAYRFEPDVALPSDSAQPYTNEKVEAIQNDFDNRRPNDALLRTLVSPDGQRALALYGTEDEPRQAFRIDMYSADGTFIRNLTPPNLACVFPETVSWSPDGSHITFIAHRAVKLAPTPTPPPELVEPEEAIPLPTVAPAFPAVALFETEQIYICNRDGYDLKPLTTREGLIYFYYSWAPDSQAVVALACKEDEWNARALEFKLPAGRPRLITLDGNERLLDDGLTEALPVWCSDGSKVATAFETEVRIYDALIKSPTQARITLRQPLIAASRLFQEKLNDTKKNDVTVTQPAAATESQEETLPPSFNPIVRLEWPTPDKLYVQTAFVRVYPNDPINTFQRWHRLFLSPQAAVLR